MEEKIMTQLPSNSTQSSQSSSSGGASSSTCIAIEIATDADFEYFSLYGNNSNNRILGEFNNIDGEYDSTFNVELDIVYQNVWTNASDPYVSTNGATIINEITNTWSTTFGSVDRDLVHLFTAKNLGSNLGRASGIGDLCTNSDANGYTRDRVNAFTTLAHEIGHNLSGIHGDGTQCGTTNASVMCQGIKAVPIYFSTASTIRIQNFINSASSMRDRLQFSWIGTGPFGQVDVSINSGSPPFKIFRGSTLLYSGSSTNVTVNFGCNGGVIKVTKESPCGTLSASDIVPQGCASFRGQSTMMAYPNPTTSMVNVAQAEEFEITRPDSSLGALRLELYDFNGNQIKSQDYSDFNGEVQMNMSDLKRATYLLRIVAKEVDEVHQIIKE